MASLGYGQQPRGAFFPVPVVIGHGIMTKSWDAIVVGAGVGGLTAAATIVKAGRRVLVLEKSPHPGGTAYVYKRKGFTFPMGPLGFSTPGLVRQILAELGQKDDLDFSPVVYQIKAFRFDIPLSRPFDQLTGCLKKTFPGDAQGLEKFFQDMAGIITAMQSPEKMDNRKVLEQSAKTSASQYLSTHIADWRLQRFLGSLGTREPYSNMALLAAMWNLMANEGIWYPVGGMRSFCHRLVQAVVQSWGQHGPLGEIRLGADVEKIRVKNGNVLGVRLKDGTQIDAENVISNADFKTTFLKLVDSQSLPSQWRQGIGQAKQTGSVLQVCLGFDARRVDLSAFSQASRLLCRRSSGAGVEPRRRNIDWMAHQVDLDALADQEIEMGLLSKEDPMLAPKGGGVMVIRTEADHGHFSRYRSPTQRRMASYTTYKMGLAEALIKEAAHVVPGLEKAVEVVDVATPLTFEDQGGRSQGAVAGWSWDYEDTTDFEPVELILTPVHGLYMAGYQAYSTLFMGGVPTAMTSGQKAAQHLLKGAGPATKLTIPGIDT